MSRLRLSTVLLIACLGCDNAPSAEQPLRRAAAAPARSAPSTTTATPTRAPRARKARSTVLCDFERKLRGWVVKGYVMLERRPAPGHSTGSALRVFTTGQTGAFKTWKQPIDWSTFEELRLSVYREPNERPTVIELQFLEADGRARFWRKVVLDHSGWRELRLPLAWFRWGRRRVPRWDRIDRLGIWFRNQATVWIDDVRLIPGARQPAAKLDASRLAEVAFPGPKASPRTTVGRWVEVVTDAPRLETKKLVDHLDAVAQAVFEEMPYLDHEVGRVPFVISASLEGYRDFVVRLAARLGATAQPPRGGGFTTRGVCASYYDARWGTLRPVYTHEFVHGLLAQALRIPNSTEWLHEGLASHFQARFHVQKDLPALVQAGIARRRGGDLARLTRGNPIRSGQYWQAMTLVRTLLHDPLYRDRLPAMFKTLADRGTRLVPKTMLGSDWSGLTRRWLKTCRALPK